MAQHIGWLRQRGVAGIVALGSTGEFPRFSVEQRKAIVRAVIRHADGLPVVVNVSDIQFEHAAALARFAAEEGAAGIAIMPPWFYPVSQADLLEFFLRVAAATSLPVLLYNFPELAGTRIDLETVEAFAERAPMHGIKQSGGEFGYHEALIELGRKKNYVVFSGADTRLAEVFGLGAAGCIGGMVNFVPEMMVEIYKLCQRGRQVEARPLTDRMKEAGAIIDQLTFPLNVAAGMEARGLTPGSPKTVVSAASAITYQKIVAQLRAKWTEWNLEPADLVAEGGRNAS